MYNIHNGNFIKHKKKIELIACELMKIKLKTLSNF